MATEDLKTSEDKTFVTSMKVALEIDEDLGDISMTWKDASGKQSISVSEYRADPAKRQQTLTLFWDALDSDVRDAFVEFAYRWMHMPLYVRSALACVLTAKTAEMQHFYAQEAKFFEERKMDRRTGFDKKLARGFGRISGLFEALARNADGQIARAGIDTMTSFDEIEAK